MVFYVGKTSRPFSTRMREHLKEYLSGMYDIYQSSSFLKGERELLWEGMWRPGDEIRFPDFLAKHEELWPHLSKMITAMRIHLGAIEGGDKRLMERVEGAIALNLRQQPGRVGEFQNPDIRNQIKRPGEEGVLARIASDVPLLGVPVEIEI